MLIIKQRRGRKSSENREVLFSDIDVGPIKSNYLKQENLMLLYLTTGF
jgi:hypothetical protein